MMLEDLGQGGAVEAHEHSELSRRRTLIIIGALLLGMLLAALDQTIVATALPTIAGDLHGLSHLSWVVTAYLLASTVSTPLWGKLGDLYGRKVFFEAAIVIFLIGSALCGLAHSILILIVFRAVQGIGGGGLLTGAQTIVADVVPARDRGRYQGLFGSVFGVTSVIGPLIGGFFVDNLSWRWVFYVNLPIGIVAWLAGRRLLREARDESATRWPDAVGVVLVTLAVGALSLGIVQGTDWGWGDPRIVGAFAAAAVLVPLVVLRAARHPAPVIDLALFRVRSFAVANVATVLFATAFSAMLLSGVLFLTGVWHYSILQAGLAVSPGPLFAAAFAPPAGRLADRFGHRAVLVPGALVFALGIGLYLTRVTLAPDYVGTWLLAACVTGIGVGLTLPTLGSSAAASLPAARFGSGSAVSNTARQVGFVLGVSLLVVVLGDVTRGGALAAFQRGWTLMLALALATGAVCVVMGRTRVARPVERAA
jgi:EmrB/QacA subfamily drug resistance transporter